MSATALIIRLSALLDALHDGPLDRPALHAKLGTAYPEGDSARRMIARDIAHLTTLGVQITLDHGRPPIYRLKGGTPHYTQHELHTLALLRDSFGSNHPNVDAIQALISRLTIDLSDAEHQIYIRRQASSAPLQPAIDYTPYADLIAQLAQAISVGLLLRLRYRNSTGRETAHRMVEPSEIEYHERHFYLVAYSQNSGQIHDFRIDRILQIEPLQRQPPGAARARPLISFRYRLAASLAQGEISQRFSEQQVVERLDSGDVIIAAAGRSDFFIIQTLLRYRALAELLDPPWLRAKMAEEVRRLAGLYGGDVLE